MNQIYLTNQQIDDIRRRIITFASKLLDVPYSYGSEWTNYNEVPEALDCSELTEGVYNHFGLRLPDGSQNQFYFTRQVETPHDADLAFFGRGGKENQIYHVGMVIKPNIIEARAFQPNSSFKTGCVILRPMEKWEQYKNFAGYRSLPKLIYQEKKQPVEYGPRLDNVA